MSKKKKIKTETPKFEQDPLFRQGISSLIDTGGRLSSFDFTGSLSPLAETIALDPEITDLALQQAQAELGPAFEDTINQIKQEAAAANQLESSVFADALAREGGRLNQAFQGITAGAALEDRTRALNNRITLQQLGIGATQAGTGLAAESQRQKNEFNLRNFENQLAIETFNRSNRGGLFGGITGAIGGGLSGFLLGGPAGAAVGALGGGLAGGFGPSGTGGQLLNTGTTLAAFKPRTFAGKTAGNTQDLFGGISERGPENRLLDQLRFLG